jgi:peptide/nickel transport system substrate-binding protein
MLALASALEAQHGGELRFCLRADPKTFHPLQVEDDASEAIRYLTGGVLIRVNRTTQELQPELAASWKVELGGRRIRFELRQGPAFSDGTPFSAEDVAYTMRSLMDPALHSPTADSFGSGSGQPQVTVTGKDRVAITFAAPVSGLERLFDQVAILSSRSPKKEMAVLGPFFVASYQAGAEILLRRNPHYWKRDAAGRQLPYLDAVRLSIQQNREIELVRFRRGQLDLINNLDPELYHQMAPQMGGALRDLGPSLDSEMFWFNQVARAPLPEYKKAWFRSMQFRRAVSEAINREDLCRVVFRGHARPAEGPVSPANRFWFHSKLKPHAYDPKSALRRLWQDGFRLANGVLRDRGGNAVEFSVVTNAGNKTRERMALLIQQDLRAVGIKLNVVTLDFPSLIERLSRSYAYEACLLGLTNVDLDPNGQMNVWLSSAANHQWNPSQKAPETAWEAEIDRLMQAQAAAQDRNARKRHFDRVQEIAWEQAPFLYLVNKSALAAYSPSLGNVAATALRPQIYWNIEHLTRVSQMAGNR